MRVSGRPQGWPGFQEMVEEMLEEDLKKRGGRGGWRRTGGEEEEEEEGVPHELWSGLGGGALERLGGG